MVDLLTLEKSFIAAHLREGGTAVDFTMGNGHDTLYLSQMVGENGTVYAFDIQVQALESTQKLLTEQNAFPNYTLLLDSHSHVLNYVTTPIQAGMFNLGYLPGGNKQITTLRATTLLAIDGGLSLLDHDGILLIAVYPGHPEGEIEGKLVQEHLSHLERKEYCVAQFKILNSASSPYFITVERK